MKTTEQRSAGADAAGTSEAPEAVEVPEAPDAADGPEAEVAGGPGSAQAPVAVAAVKAPDAAEADESSAAADADPDPDPDPADDADVGSADDSGDAAAEKPRRSLRPRWPRFARSNPWRAAVAALVVVLLPAGGGFGYAAHRLDDPAAARNHALTDTEATSRLTGEISDALSRIFAYTPDDTQSTAQAARDLLEGAAATQYQQLFAQIRQQVTDQRLTLATRVVRAGVVSLTGDHARLLVFLDQTAQRAGATATSAAAQLSVTAHQVGGHWRISDLKAR